MKQLLQTKEDIRSIMIEAFSPTLPELKKLSSSYPIIAIAKDKDALLDDNYTLFWIWMLPNNQAITYGENNENRFIFYPVYPSPIKLANIGNEAYFKSSAELNSANEDDYTHLCVKKITFMQDDMNFTDKVIVVLPSPKKQKDIYKLYAKKYQCFDS